MPKKISWWCWWWWWFQGGSKRSKLRGSKRSKSRGSKRPRDPTYVHIYIYIYIYCIYIETIAIYGSISVGEKTWTEQWANLNEFPYRWSAMGSRTSPSIQRPLYALLHWWAVSWWCLRRKRPCPVPNMPSICTGWHVVLGRKCLNDTNSSEW